MKKWKIKFDAAKAKHRAFFLEDRDFLFSLICFFGMLQPEREYYYYKIACLEEIALKKKWINKNIIEESIKFYGNCDFSKYLKRLIS